MSRKNATSPKEQEDINVIRDIIIAIKNKQQFHSRQYLKESKKPVKPDVSKFKRALFHNKLAKSRIPVTHSFRLSHSPDID